MARLTAGIGEAYYAIKRWKGVNENPDGDTNLKDGEAAVMRNFRITDGGALRKRPGSELVAGLTESYVVDTDENREEVLVAETGKATATFTGYPYMVPDSVGVPTPDGEAVSITKNNWQNYVGYFVPHNNKLWRFKDLKETPATYIQTNTGGSFSSPDYRIPLSILVFDEPPVFHNGTWDLSNAKVCRPINGGGGDNNPVGKYTILSDDYPYSLPSGLFSYGTDISEFKLNTLGYYGKIVEGGEWWVSIYEGWKFNPWVEVYTSPVFQWRANPTISTPNESGQVVRGLWSGFVGDKEYIIAACNGYLWSLEETDGVWRKRAIGTIDTSDHVCLFGFDGKLYCLDGKEYYVWDGNVLRAVDGYVPLLANATPPYGGGTLLERANTLTPKRRQRFSADGTATEFKLIESNIQMVDSATVNGAAVQFTADTASGKVTFSSAPAAGTDNVEITWTAKGSSRESVVKMRYAEFYNGANDSRVFLYGDGSNITFYSDITESGAASAEYFPALNEIAVGDSNTPLTSLIRQYSRLMAFKSGGSAWSIYYDAITLADGSVTAGFYCNPVNKSIGNAALGQAVLVENKPRTLDGRSIYEWQSASGGYITNDQRNAQRISQKVENTLLGFDLSQCVMFFDKIKHEFYCVYGDKAVVQNTENGSWYIYTNFPAAALIVHKDELYYGTPNGDLRKFSDDYTGDSGNPIDAYWESGSLSFGRDYILKYSPTVWVGLKQEDNAAVEVGIETDQEAPIYEAISLPADVDAMPRMNRARLKAKKFTYYKLLFKSHTADTKATVVAADVRVKYNINVK